jgi:hypothetical protein
MEVFLLGNQFLFAGFEAFIAIVLVAGLGRRYPDLHVYWLQLMGIVAIFALIFFPHGYVLLFDQGAEKSVSFFGFHVWLSHAKLLKMDLIGVVSGSFVGAVLYMLLESRARLATQW